MCYAKTSRHLEWKGRNTRHPLTGVVLTGFLSLAILDEIKDGEGAMMMNKLSKTYSYYYTLRRNRD